MTRLPLAGLALIAAAILYITAPSGAVAQSGSLPEAEHHMYTRDHSGPWAPAQKMEESADRGNRAEAGPFELGSPTDSRAGHGFSEMKEESGRSLENVHNHGEP